MARTSTTSIRLDEHLAHRIEQAASRFHLRKNGLIVRAIEEFLDEHADRLLSEDARRQSILASKSDRKSETEDWEKAHDSRGWQS